jgi:hypothetical protein
MVASAAPGYDVYCGRVSRENVSIFYTRVNFAGVKCFTYIENIFL